MDCLLCGHPLSWHTTITLGSGQTLHGWCYRREKQSNWKAARKVLRDWVIPFAIGIAIFAAACSNPAAPRDCVSAAEEVGAPQVVLDFLNNPTGDLNQAEKLVIRQFLNRSALNDVCGDARAALD